MSGGGSSFLRNWQLAAENFDVLAVEGEGTPLCPRNIPVDRRVCQPFLLAPQNAWAWNRAARGARERARVWTLWSGSEFYARRAAAVLRISGAIPAKSSWSRVSPVIHNVLDLGFEVAIIESEVGDGPAVGGDFVTIGSVHTYRNLPLLIAAFGRYRRGGGHRSLHVFGPARPGRALSDVMVSAAETDGVTVSPGSLARSTVLQMMRDAHATILPSRVEASPLSALESLTVSKQTLLSSIRAHREIVQPWADESALGWFDPTSVASMHDAMVRADDGVFAGVQTPLGDRSRRDAARQDWSRHVAGWCEEVLAELS